MSCAAAARGIAHASTAAAKAACRQRPRLIGLLPNGYRLRRASILDHRGNEQPGGSCAAPPPDLCCAHPLNGRRAARRNPIGALEIIGVAGMGWMPAALTATVLAVYCGGAQAIELPANDYPTAARADYVFGCMQVNGQTRDALERCACSIDVIASLLPYDRYEEAETVMRVRQRGGKNASMFLSMPMLRAMVDELKRAQVEAELRCF